MVQGSLSHQTRTAFFLWDYRHKGAPASPTSMPPLPGTPTHQARREVARGVWEAPQHILGADDGVEARGQPSILKHAQHASLRARGNSRDGHLLWEFEGSCGHGRHILYDAHGLK